MSQGAPRPEQHAAWQLLLVVGDLFEQVCVLYFIVRSLIKTKAAVSRAAEPFHKWRANAPSRLFFVVLIVNRSIGWRRGPRHTVRNAESILCCPIYDSFVYYYTCVYMWDLLDSPISSVEQKKEGDKQRACSDVEGREVALLLIDGGGGG